MKKILFFISFFLFTTLTAQVTDSTKLVIEKQLIEKRFDELKQSETEIKAKIYDHLEQLKAILNEQASLKRQYQEIDKKLNKKIKK